MKRHRNLLPRTGQTTSFPNGDATDRDDGHYQSGWPGTTRFIDNGNNTVTDRATGLTWIKDHDALGSPFNAIMSWADAVTNIATLNGGAGYAGHTDWRLPNVNELQSLYAWADASGAAIDAIFSNTHADDYWSSTTWAALNTYAIRVRFSNSPSVVNIAKTTTYYVRPVRGGRING